MERLIMNDALAAKVASYILNLDITYVKALFQADTQYFVEDLTQALQAFEYPADSLDNQPTAFQLQNPLTLLLKTIQNFYYILNDEGKHHVKRFLQNATMTKRSNRLVKNHDYHDSFNTLI